MPHRELSQTPARQAETRPMAQRIGIGSALLVALIALLAILPIALA